MTRSRLLGIGLVAMIILPAVVLAILGYGSFEAEARVEASERKLRVRLAFNRAHAAATDLLERVEAILPAREKYIVPPEAAEGAVDLLLILNPSDMKQTGQKSGGLAPVDQQGERR